MGTTIGVLRGVLCVAEQVDDPNPSPPAARWRTIVQPSTAVFA
jgi:hypothetical protein